MKKFLGIMFTVAILSSCGPTSHRSEAPPEPVIENDHSSESEEHERSSFHNHPAVRAYRFMRGHYY